MGVTDTYHYLLNDVAKYRVYIQICSSLPGLGLLYYNQFCYDKVLLMKRYILLFFMNNLFSNLNPRVNISLTSEIFHLQLPPFLSYTRTSVN